MIKFNIYLYSTQDINQMGGGGNSSSTTFKYLKEAGHNIAFFKSIIELEKVLKKNKPDILLHHNISDLNGVYQLSKKYKVPIIVTINNLITCQTGVHIKYNHKFGVVCKKCSFWQGLKCQFNEKNVRPWNEKLFAILFYLFRYHNHIKRLDLLNKVNGIIAISPTLKELLIENGVSNNIFVCQQPIDDKMLNKSINLFKFNKKTIFYQGGGEPFKGIRILIEAFVNLNRDDVQLIIAGDVRPENNLNINLIEQKYKNIKFLSQISQEDMKKYYSSIDIFVFPSLWLEAFGRGWAEAACIGKSIITFKDRGGSSDYLKNNENALIIDTNINSLIIAINKLLDNSKLRNKLSTKVKEFAKKELIASKVIKKLELIYNEVLTNR